MADTKSKEDFANIPSCMNDAPLLAKIKAIKSIPEVYVAGKDSMHLSSKDLYFSEDSSFLENYIATVKNEDDILQLQFPPEPWIGNIQNPKVIILSGNPGFDYTTSKKRKSNQDRFKDLVAKNKLTDFLNIVSGQIIGTENFLSHQICEDENGPIRIGEGDYWKIKLNSLCTASKKAGEKFLVLEVHPYHSAKFQTIGNKDIGLLPSQEAILKLAKKVIQQKDVIVLIQRAQQYWFDHLRSELKEVESKGNLYKLSCAQNGAVTKRNLINLPKGTIDSILEKEKAFNKLRQVIESE